MRTNMLLVGIGLLCLAATSVEAAVITAAGSTTVLPALKGCGKSFQAKHADVYVISAGGGSSKGVSSVGRGKVDIGTASRAVKDKELAAYPGLKQYKLATDGVVVIVNSANPLTSISADQVAKLYNGAADNWSVVGGSDATVNLVTLGMEHGTYELFSKFFHLRGEESEGNIQFSKGKAWIAFSQDVALDRVAHDEHAIAFASIGVATAFAEKTGQVKLLLLDGVAATEANVTSGSYALVRPLLLLTNGEAQGEVKNFIDYLQGKECQSSVKDMGYIPVQ